MSLMFDFSGFSIKKARRGLSKKEFSARDLAEFYFGKIKEKDGEIGSFLGLSPETALAEADEIDQKIKSGDMPALAGAPMAIKDNILVKGLKCSAGSKILENYAAPYDATVIKKLKKAGAVILGKTNMDEFAMGSSTENSAFKITRNPLDLERVPGGSSGGSAAAVSADLCLAALGSDTGGSIRLPAGFCGVVGFKPTYGAVSRYGLIAMASSLDQIGPMAKTVDDAKAIFDIIAGKDPLDSTSLDLPKTGKTEDLKGFRLGIPKEYFGEGIEAETKKALELCLEKMEENGAKLVEVDLPYSKYCLAVYYLVIDSEISANLARFDGIRYGKSKREGRSLLEIYQNTRQDFLGSEVKRRIIMGTFALSAGYYDAYYGKAQKVRTLIQRDFFNALDKCDVIIAPVSPSPAFKIGEKAEDPMRMYLSDIYTVSANLAGLPAISLPCGKAHGLPVGIQALAKPMEDQKCWAAAKFIENLTKF